MRKLLALLLTVVTSLPAPAFAQDDPWDTVQNLLVGTKVTLTLTTEQTVSGTVVEIEPDAVVLDEIDQHGVSVSLPASATRPNGARAFPRSLVKASRVDRPVVRYKLRNGRQPDPDAVRVVAAALGVGRKVDLRTADGMRFRRARIGSLDDRGLTVRQGSPAVSTAIAYSDVAELKPGALTGAQKTGLVIGAIFGFLLLVASSISY